MARGSLRHALSIALWAILAILVAPLYAATAVVLTTTGSNTWAVPSNWNSGNNTIETIGGGAGGPTNGNDAGGGGGYSKSTNVTLTGGGNVTYVVGVGGHKGTQASSNTDQTSGGDTFLCNATSNCATIAGTAVQTGAKGGHSINIDGNSLGGAAASGVGATKNSGGNGGTQVSGSSGPGGGGAGGSSGNGTNGGNAAGSPGGGTGGAGGGTCADSVTAAGAGGHGMTDASGGLTAGSNYGGGGGAAKSGGGDGSDGAQGVIVAVYTPAGSTGAPALLRLLGIGGLLMLLTGPRRRR